GRMTSTAPMTSSWSMNLATLSGFLTPRMRARVRTDGPACSRASWVVLWEAKAQYRVRASGSAPERSTQSPSCVYGVRRPAATWSSEVSSAGSMVDKAEIPHCTRSLAPCGGLSWRALFDVFGRAVFDVFG